MTPAVAMHNTKSHGGGQSDHKWHCKIVYNNGDLFISFVVCKHDRAIFARVVAGEDGPLVAVGLREVDTEDRRGIPAALDVDEEDRVVGLVMGVRVVVADVDMGAVICVTGAALAAGAPGAVGQAGELLAPGGHAGHRLGDEVGGECGNGGVHVQRHQEQQRRPGRHGHHRQQAGGVEQGLLAT